MYYSDDFGAIIFMASKIPFIRRTWQILILSTFKLYRYTKAYIHLLRAYQISSTYPHNWFLCLEVSFRGGMMYHVMLIYLTWWQVVEVSTSKTGKHGHAKCHFVGIDIFNGKKLEDIVPSSHNCDVCASSPILRWEYLCYRGVLPPFSLCNLTFWPF